MSDEGRATDFPMGRRPRNNKPLPTEAVLPFTEQHAINLFRSQREKELLAAIEAEKYLEDPEAALALADAIDEMDGLPKPVPLVRQEVREAISRVLLPVILDDLAFMGMAEPDIRVKSAWTSQADAAMDMDGLVLATEGRVPAAIFVLLFALVCRTCGASTTAHRRFKGKFAGERIHIVIDMERDAVQMALSQNLMDALNIGWASWMRGR